MKVQITNINKNINIDENQNLLYTFDLSFSNKLIIKSVKLLKNIKDELIISLPMIIGKGKNTDIIKIDKKLRNEIIKCFKEDVKEQITFEYDMEFNINEIRFLNSNKSNVKVNFDDVIQIINITIEEYKVFIFKKYKIILPKINMTDENVILIDNSLKKNIVKNILKNK